MLGPPVSGRIPVPEHRNVPPVNHFLLRSQNIKFSKEGIIANPELFGQVGCGSRKSFWIQIRDRIRTC
jgi:hypothetical protein